MPHSIESATMVVYSLIVQLSTHSLDLYFLLFGFLCVLILAVRVCCRGSCKWYDSVFVFNRNQLQTSRLWTLDFEDSNLFLLCTDFTRNSHDLLNSSILYALSPFAVGANWPHWLGMVRVACPLIF